MKTRIYMIAMMLITISFQSIAGESDADATENRKSDPYHFIRIIGDMNVMLVQNEIPAITLSGTNQQLKNTVTLLKNDTLLIYSTSAKKSNKKLSIKINIDNLVGLDVNGKSKVECDGYISSDIFSIKAEGGSEIKIDVRALKVDSKATGCSHINISGSTGEFIEAVYSCKTSVAKTLTAAR